MHTPYGHLTYCTNIHAGESWADHFRSVREVVPGIKAAVSPEAPFGLGLRISGAASSDLLNDPQALPALKKWLQENDCYVFTLNGFPYGGFHGTRVKDSVHKPDWTTDERVDYTIRLARILAELLPEGLEGGISTSPLSYVFWHEETERPGVVRQATDNLLRVVAALIRLRAETGKWIHIDIEPEPDGLLGNGPDFFEWYENILLPQGINYLRQTVGGTPQEAEAQIKEYVQLCYDVCHFAVGFEDHAQVVERLRRLGIRTGKIQISAALKASFTQGSEAAVLDAFRPFNESTYLHQVLARGSDGAVRSYADLPEALASGATEGEWRAHFHVPIFLDGYGLLQSTRTDIEAVLRLHREQPFTRHLEVETYTWEVLPPELKGPLGPSITRELQWVQEVLRG
ncbi:MAG TPA: metabolite traffic protein EboE [Chitinophagaceae bacterium]|jgi:hypothetical protein|nr:metabolite traffic protein EboE [Chitinophagaceae bacterium]